MVGLHDLLSFKDAPKRATLHNIDVNYAVVSMMMKYEDLISKTYSINPNVKVVLCQLYGMDLSSYQDMEGRHPHQSVLEDTIVMLNGKLMGLNKSTGSFTPFTGKMCHTYHSKRGYSHSYDNLDTRGIPFQNTQQLVSQWIKKSVVKNTVVVTG